MTQDLPDIRDIGSAGELIRYTVRAQLALVSEAATQNTIAKAIGMARNPTTSTAAANFSHTLARGAFANTKLQKLDEVIVALAPATAVHAGSLSSFAICLRGLKDRESLSNRVPASWTQEILQKPADDDFGVLTQASALLSAFLAAEGVEKVSSKSIAVRSLRDRYSKEITQVVDQLIMLAFAPPTSRSVEALIVLGALGGYAFDIVKTSLDYALLHPLGFRVWRVISTLVMLNNKRASRTLGLRSWTERLLTEAENLRGRSIYPARSLDLELAISVPPGWSPPEHDWAGAALIARAANPDATIRERGTAITGLWQRAMADQHSEQQSSADRVKSLLSEFESAAANSDTRQGVRWTAATLRRAMEHNVGVCNEWPQVGESWMQHVNEAVSYLERQVIPQDVLPGTRTLFRHSLLQNAGVYRRQAIEALVAGGWTEPVARALERFLELETKESWIRIRALFALGFLQHRDASVEHYLSDSCHHAYSNLKDNPTDAQIAEMHAALFAVGDCYGVTEISQEDVKRMREGVQGVLTKLISSGVTEQINYYPISRACAYLLTFMILPREGQAEDLAETLLKGLSNHPDRITRQLSRWALQNRLNEHGEVRQLVHARA